MGIYGALSSAVTGLRAQSHALENISGNIANSQTTGYKRMETSFIDLIPDAPLKSQVPGAVLAQSRATNNIQGDIQTSSNETYIALNANGFFVVEPKVGQSDGNSVFAGSNYFTRRGDFEIDKDGLLVNGAGYYLKGLPIDPATGNISGSVPEVIELSNAFLPANQSTTINYQANLPQLPKTANYKATVHNSELLGSEMFAGGSATAATNGTAALVAGAAAMPTFADGDTMTITANGIAVDFNFYDSGVSAMPSSGVAIDIAAPRTVQNVLDDMQAELRDFGGGAAESATVTLNGANQFAVTLGEDYHASFSISGVSAALETALGLTDPQTSTDPVLAAVNTVSADDADDFVANSISGGAITVYASNGAPVNVQLRWAKIDSAASGGTDRWNMFYLSDSSAVGGSPAWTNIGQEYEFGSNGSLSTSVPQATIDDLRVNGVLIGDVVLAHDTNGVSQFADVNGTVTVSTLNQNGYGAGEFLSVAITDSGRVVATYSNGERIEMAQVVTAQFNGINSLKRLDGGVYEATSESGEPIFDLSGSGVIGGALEASNTDISDEFTKLIITQQAYSAGTRIVSTADEMLQEALNMIR
ncbi:flagellar hook-basal body complex protein [Devosia sp. XJ19-1]|uniref:Flagellar hook protein FlgE n=1 Tax=Devosia ureilytica TaxID=2952754 RepID=A0A9Q4FSS3_9HYPH|nr:flagellar hook-basal body complex protein [Devosia ureilytica]MCP8883531.1 flagellar hook-basal body complex protein [Devosia ureilytica]MCP8887139.1 flagellar hook-basal body complex protein [Devosia ureilytica]